MGHLLARGLDAVERERVIVREEAVESGQKGQECENLQDQSEVEGVVAEGTWRCLRYLVKVINRFPLNGLLLQSYGFPLPLSLILDCWPRVNLKKHHSCYSFWFSSH